LENEMDRQTSAQDITWFLDLHKNNQLDLDPPYQRRSVWTAKDRRFFLDTVFRNFPSPAIFLYKNIDDNGAVTYHVVDGKQRLQTILNFVINKIRIGDDFGDARLAGKRWKDISTETELKRAFWNYRVPVEMIDARDGALVNAVFDRLNRNSRKLTQQELRHAKFDGWFISVAEREADNDYWRDLGIATRSRSKRMTDVQFISELMAALYRGQPLGFDQEGLDELYGELDDLAEVPDFDADNFLQKFEAAKSQISKMEENGKVVATWAKSFGPFYSLWCAVALNLDLPDAPELASRYSRFMTKVNELAELAPGLPAPAGQEYELAAAYRENSRGASTEGPQRVARHDALSQALKLP
jgi:Protein of unknown function DUF262